MGTGAIQAAIRAASEYLAQHPEHARSTDSAASATLVDGLVVRVTGPAGATITTNNGSLGRRYGDRAIAGLAPAGR